MAQYPLPYIIDPVNENRPLTVAIHTLGCKLNQAESETLAREFLNRGYRVGQPDEACDIFILNTCTVTHVADRKARQLLRMARRQNPNALVVATGCFAERMSTSGSLDGVDLVAGNADKATLPEKIEQLLNIQPSSALAPAVHQSPGGRTRAMVKIQDGCSQACSYCIVPSVRGKGKSVEVSSVLDQIKSLVEEGYQEIILTGTDIGTYKSGKVNLVGILREILAETTVPRLRLSSLQAQEISPDLLPLFADPRICRHVHLPLQSGSDAVLRDMRRRYTTEEFRQAASRLRHIAPDIAITTDVIVGFPGETPSHFAETRILCKDVGFARIHAFPYSPRPGTPAAGMTPRVDSSTQNERLAIMLQLAKESGDNFKQRFLGTVLPVLWETSARDDPSLFSGLTDNYIRVYVKTQDDLRNRIIPTRLLRLENGKVFGELV